MGATGQALSLSIIDAGLSSLAGFLIGIYAVLVLEPSELGVYGLFFAGFVLAGMLHGEGVFTPAEVALLAHAPSSQLAALPVTLRVGLVPALVSSSLTFAVTMAVAPHERPGLVAVIAAGAAVAAFVSPFQDHVRRVLHQSSNSATAASVAVVQLASVVSMLAVLHVAPVRAAAVPFAALAGANTLSLGYGLLRARQRAADEVPTALRAAVQLRRLAPVGRWLLYGNGIERLVVLGAVALVTRVSGTVAAGHVEAVRVLAQPVVVAAVAANIALRSRSVAAARAADLAAARRWRSLHVAVVAGGTVAYGLVALVPWPHNVVRSLYAPAFAVPGLGALMLVATALLMVTLPWPTELVATGGERTAGHALAGGALALGSVAAAAVLLGAGPFAVPLGIAVAGPTRIVLSTRALRSRYTTSGGTDSPGAGRRASTTTTTTTTTTHTQRTGQPDAALTP